MKTKFAMAFYYLAIGSLVITAGGIVWKLIIFPPCTPTGNTCTVDPGTVAGLAGTVLAVAATVLAILGAVAVAAWWTSLNDRVVEQVNKLYATQRIEVDERVGRLWIQKQKQIDDRLTNIRALMVEARAVIDEAIDQVRQSRNSNAEAQKKFDDLIAHNEELAQLAYQIKESQALIAKTVSTLRKNASPLTPPKEAHPPDTNNSTGE